MTNPLLNLTGLPAFSQIRAEHVEPAIDQILAENRARINELLQRDDFTWSNLIELLEELDDRLGRAWAPVSHLNSVANSEELRKAYNACLPKLSEYGTELGHNERLYRAYRSIADGPEMATLEAAQRKVIENALRDFHLAGIDLVPEKKARFKEISQELSKLSSQFQENVLDATHAWDKQITDAEELAGLPESAVALAAQTAQQKNKEGWVLTLDFPSYMPVMSYADNRELRREMYTAYLTRASDQGPHAGTWDNGEIMERILALRHELAHLLGYANYAELSLATKMAESPSQVLAFLHDLAQRSAPVAQRELEEIRSFAKQQYGVEELEVWDIPYYAEKLRQKRYAISQEQLKPYFPVPHVLEGLFAIVSRLYGVHIREGEGVDIWHPDVRFFEIQDTAGTCRGQFYVDLYARPKKRGGAWMASCIGRRRKGTTVQTPVAFLACNFTPPIGDQPALLTHDEVITLFHEFGHALHHLLTQVDYLEVAGINGVAWDAVELPSQFMENWCWEREALDLLARHYETGEKLPQALFERLLAARDFQAGMKMVRQLEFALFDFRLHTEYDPTQGGRIYQILKEVQNEVAVVKPPSFNRFAHGFTHIFVGGYAAGYYSYKWAEVLSADAFAKFEETGIFNSETGRAFLHNILEQGGSQDAMKLFVQFRGREPKIDALLRHNGIAA